MLGIVDMANAADLYWKIVNGDGKTLAEVSSVDIAGAPLLEKDLQGRYPGIKLSIKKCKQPTLVEAMNPVYGKYWQCGTIVYRGHVTPLPKPPIPAVMFAPSASQWQYLGYDAGNDIMFINKAHLSKGHVFVWTEDYGAFALADAVSEHTGTNVYALDLENGAPNLFRRTAEQIVNAHPPEIGGSTYRTSIHAQRNLFEINCALSQMREIETIFVNGTIDNSPSPWFKPTMSGGRLKLLQRECGQ